MSGYTIVNTVTKKMQTCATIWMIIGIFQILVGLVGLLFCVGFTSIIVGIWNVVQSNRQLKNAKYFIQTPVGIHSYYQANKTMIVVFVFINLFFGSVFGIIGSIYELTICSFVETHKNELMEVEQDVQVRRVY